MLKKLLLATALTAMVGCDPIKDVIDDVTEDTYVVTVGVENGYAGDCPGALLDCNNMCKLMKPYASKIHTLMDQQATYNAVVAAMKEGVKHNLFIFFYSGHGGYVATLTDRTEADGNDEFICLYDKGLVDNTIWNIIKESKGRVFLIFDCCHSGTMYRTAKPLDFNKQLRKLAATSTVSGSINMLCWSGCPDSTYSYGSKDGGELTNTLRKYFKSSMTYNELWNKIESDKSLKEYEKVQRTIMGKNFGSSKIFR